MNLADKLLDLAKEAQEEKKLPEIERKEKLLSLEMTLKTVVPPAEPILSIDGSDVCTLGNFSAIIGKAKSRKTFYTSLLVAGALLGLDDDAQVAWFDTEQGDHHVMKVLKRAFILSGLDEETFTKRFRMFPMRNQSVEEVNELIELACYDLPGLKLVVIDGVRDMVQDINAPEEATKVSRWLLKWSAERHIHIVTVLHQNKGDNHARGHLGSEIINKAESVISVEKDENNKDVSIVSAPFIREKDFEPFVFGIDENGLPQIQGAFSEEPSVKSKYRNPTDFTTEEHYEIIQAVFKSDDELTLTDYQDRLLYQSELYNFDISARKMGNWITHHLEKNMMTLSGHERAKNKSYTITTRAKTWKREDQEGVPF